MTNPNPGGIKLPMSPGQPSAMNMPWVTGKVISIDLGRNVAQVVDTMTRQIEVRMDIQRGKGSLPEVGETWIIDKSYGAWTFAACLRNESQGVITPIENIPDLAPTLRDKQDQIDNNASVVAGMQVTITITNVQGNYKRVVDGTLSDGTKVTALPCAAAYYPQVGDVAWVLRQGVPTGANSTPSLIAIGRSNVIPGSAFGQGYVIRPQVVAESALYLMADRRLAAPASGGPYQVSRGQIDADGTPIYSSWIDTIMYGTAKTPFERNNVLDIGICWWTDGFYFTKADGAGRADIAGVGNVYPGGELVTSGRIRAGTTLAGNSVFADTSLFVGTELTVRGATNTNGLNTSSLQVGAAGAPADRQIMTFNLTATNNILCRDGTIFYRGGQLPAAASERSLKTHIEELGEPDQFLSALVPSRFRWLDTFHFDSREHVGVMVDEMAEQDESTIIYPPVMPSDLADAETVAQFQSNHGRVPDERALIAYLVKGWQRHQARINDLERRLSERS